MTDERPDQLGPQGPRRAASVTLRTQTVGDDGDSQMFDPANQSAADALRISYQLLLLGIGVLIALFFISGFKTVEEGRVGIRLMAGEIKGRNLQPGMRWSWPQPLGEILTFHRNPTPIEIRGAFYPRVGREPTESLERLAETGSGNLDPRADNSLITGDMNLCHAQWVVQYRREDVDKFAENIHDKHEENIVRMAVQRGAVLAVSQSSLDDVLKPGGQTSSLVAERARLYAQQMLDKMDSGLRIDVLDMQRTTVPLGIYKEWAQMAGEDAVAAQTIDEARGVARETLNKIAGAAAPHLIERIDAYERAVELGEVDEQERLLAEINSIIDGKPLDVGGEQIIVSGDVARIINMARQYRNTVAQGEEIKLAKYNSIKEQFQSNPLVVVHREWSDAYREFRAKPFVQMMQIPPGTSLVELLINEDPEIVRAMQMDKQRAENAAAHLKRMDELNNQRLTPQIKRILSAEPDN